MKIVVIGQTAEGKSTIARLIERALKDNDIYNVSVVDDLEEEESHLNWKLRRWHQQKRLKCLAEKNLKIIIETCQTKRESSN